MNLRICAVVHVARPVVTGAATGRLLRCTTNQLHSNRGVRTVHPAQITLVHQRKFLQALRIHICRVSLLHRLSITGHQHIVEARQPVANERIHAINVLLVHVRRNERFGHILCLLLSRSRNVFAVLLEVIELHKALIGLVRRGRRSRCRSARGCAFGRTRRGLTGGGTISQRTDIASARGQCSQHTGAGCTQHHAAGHANRGGGMARHYQPFKGSQQRKLSELTTSSYR